jgi:hypothetical protein
MKHKILESVLKQIIEDVESGDMTPIEELISEIPDAKAIAFLPEELWHLKGDKDVEME